MSMSRCLIRRYKDATAPNWRRSEIGSLIAHYQCQLNLKHRQILSTAILMRELEAEAGRENLYGCRGIDCDEVCSGLCYITYCTDKQLVASYQALAKASDALYAQANSLVKKLGAAERVKKALRANYPILEEEAA